MLTSVPPQEGKQESAQLGAVHYITKPLEYDTIIGSYGLLSNVLSLIIWTTSLLLLTAGCRRWKMLGGGINQSTVTLIEGSTSTGKRSLSAFYLCFADGWLGVSYFA